MIPRSVVRFVFLGLLSIATAAPVEPTSKTSENSVTDTPDCNNENAEVYDQRQNGTENYRIHVNGVVVLVAPPETILQASQLSNVQMISETETSTFTAQAGKPKPQTSTVDKVPADGANHPKHDTTNQVHIKDKNNLKLLNLLHMFRSIKHEREGEVEKVQHVQH